MANCSEMKKGDTFVCKTCGLELQVSKACSCGIGGRAVALSTPVLRKDMTKK